MTEPCDHPPRKLVSWFASDTLTLACSGCMTLLVGAEEEVTKRVHRNGSTTVEYRYRKVAREG